MINRGRMIKRERMNKNLVWSIGLTVLIAVLYLMLGELRLSPVAAWKALAGIAGDETSFIVRELRAPRLAIALLVGASLSLAGAILQAVIRNPLAAPDVVGITGGASAGALAFMTLLPGLYSVHLLPFAAIAGAFIAALLIYVLAWKRGVSSLRLVLTGIGVSSLLSAFTSLMMTVSNSYTATSAYIWLTGTLYGSAWNHVWSLLPWCLALYVFVYLNTRVIGVQLLGDDLATGLGSAVQKHRIRLVLLSVALAGSAVAIGGNIGFVGLIAPHMARRLVGPGTRLMLPLSAILGGLLVAAADLAARAAFLPYDIPVGVFTSAVGAPFFIYLLYRGRRRG